MILPIQTHLITRNGTYYFRRRIPTELRTHYSPRLEIIFSLKTKDLREAERLSRAESVRLDIEFDRLKNNLTPILLVSLSKDDIKNLTNAWKAHILEENEEVRIQRQAGTINTSYFLMISIQVIFTNRLQPTLTF